MICVQSSFSFPDKAIENVCWNYAKRLGQVFGEVRAVDGIDLVIDAGSCFFCWGLAVAVKPRCYGVSLVLMNLTPGGC